MGKKRGLSWLVYSSLSIMIILLLLATVSCTQSNVNEPQISLSDAIALSKSHNIKKVELNTTSGIMILTTQVTEGSLHINDVNGTPLEVTDGVKLAASAGNLSLANLQELGFVLPSDYTTTSNNSSGVGDIISIAFPVLLIFLLFFLLFQPGRTQNQAMGFARSRARLTTPNRPQITFADVAGAEEAKEDLKEVVEFLKNRWKFQAIGATIPKGVLLVGPPGTGKTLLARAVAGEAGVPFFSVSGSEFVELYVGVGAARVRDMFEQAKRSAPCIVFIDEIDAIGRARSGVGPGTHEEREQTLNQILVEMDGFDPRIGVIVLAATNRPDVLDPALLRPGRFDRRVMLDRPDIDGRKAILGIHARGKKLDKSVDLEVVAKQTHGFSGADLASLMNEAAILAVRRGKTVIEMNEVDEAIDRIIAGPERKSIRVNPKDKELTAYHEVGHALAARMLPNVDPVHKISIVARGTMGGYTRLLTEDRYFSTASQFKETLATLLAGHAAEELIFGEASTGPHSDIRQATELARKMITDYGMSKELGLRTFGEESPYYPGAPAQRNYSEEIARQIDEEVHAILEEAHEVARNVLKENKARLAHVVGILIERETLEGDALEKAFTEPLSGTTTPAQPSGKSEIKPVSSEPLKEPAPSNQPSSQAKAKPADISVAQ